MAGMSTIPPAVAELVVLVDDDGSALGTRPKSDVHTTTTPLHLAFSCYAFNARGDVLVTERAGDKKTWPGVTTNTCCGHPAPDEDLGDAVVRRLAQELGIVAGRPSLILPRFRYRAVMDDGIVENELCPVFLVHYDGPDPEPNPFEVARAQWIPWPSFVQFVKEGGAVSPWCRDQVELLSRFGDEPARWPVGDVSELPTAARYAIDPS